LPTGRAGAPPNIVKGGTTASGAKIEFGSKIEQSMVRVSAEQINKKIDLWTNFDL